MIEDASKRHIVLYGKGGIGKTTVALNLAQALSRLGEGVAVIGCSPKSSLWDFWGLTDKKTLLDLERYGGVSPANINESTLVRNRGQIFILDNSVN